MVEISEKIMDNKFKCCEVWIKWMDKIADLNI